MHIMLDLETMSAEPNAAVVSIGAVAFNRLGLVGEPFYCIIDPESAAQAGHISGSTFKWWCQQSVEARAMFAAKGVELADALVRFSGWVGNFNHDGPACMWGNGADFDNVILGHAYRHHGMPAPWRFSNNRCYRTLKSFIDKKLHNELWAIHAVGAHHNARDDAMRQARIAVEICKKTGLLI